MSRKKKKPDGANASAELHARIVELSKLVWLGNQSHMARDLGIDQAAICRVLAGDQRPSAKFLEMLATHRDVNVAWLFRGQGKPLIEDRMRPAVGLFRPLVDELLHDRLRESDRLTGISYPIAAAFMTATSYWYRVPANSPVTKSDYLIRAGDFMLMETDADWTQKAAAVCGTFCGFKTGETENAFLLGYVDYYSQSTTFEGYEQYRVDTFDGRKGEVNLIIPETASAEREARRAIGGLCLTLNQVVCVCTKLERSFANTSRSKH